MRSNWQGNTELQERVQRSSPTVREIVDAVFEHRSDLKNTHDEWAAADGASLSGVDVLDGGGVTLSGTNGTHFDLGGTATDEVVTDLARTFARHAIYINWSAGDAPQREIKQVTAHLDPETTDGNLNVTEFRCQLYRVTSLGGSSSPTRTVHDLEPGDVGQEIAPISGVASADVPGTAAQDFTFTFGADGSVPRVGFPPSGDSNPRTVVVIWAVQSDGTPATDVAWLGDSTSDGTFNGIDGDATHVQLGVLATAGSRHVGSQVTVNTQSGMPRIEIVGPSFSSAATVSFTAAGNRLDLGASPETDSELEVVAQGQRPFGTSLTWELQDPTSAGWVEVADGDIIGEDNTGTGGNDLSGLARRQTYDARVTLTPSSDGFAAPTARILGVRELDVTELDGVTSVGRIRWSMDPVDLVGEIAELPLTINRTGIQDYRDEASELFGSNHIGEIEFRVWLGHPDMDRSEWLHIDTFLVEDYDASGGAAIHVTGISPLSVLKAAVPPFDSTNDKREPLDYTSGETLKSAYADILDSQVGLATRHRGPGIEDTTSITKKIEESDGKTEIDALAYLAGGVAITSQGRVKFQPVFNDAPPVAEIPLAEATVKTLTPGYRSRIDEFFVPFGWDTETERYIGETRTFDGDALTKLGRAKIDPPEELDDEVARWIPADQLDPPQSTLGNAVASRTVREFGTGLPVVRVDATYPHPQLEPGDPIAVQTDQLVLRDPKTDEDLRGVLWLVGTVMEVSGVWGKGLTVWIRQVMDILPTEEEGSREGFAGPEVTEAALEVVNDAGDVDLVGKVDEDAEAIRYATSTSGYPNLATTQSGTLVATSDTFDVSDVVTGLAAGGTAYASVLAYEKSDGTGAESSTLTRAKVRRGKDAANDVPTVEIEPARDGGLLVRKFTLVGTAGPGGTQGNVEVSWRLDRPETGDEGTFSAWSSSPQTITINLIDKGLLWGPGAVLIARARDTTPATPIQSKAFASQEIQPVLGPREGPSQPKGPTDEQFGRDGLGGEGPGGQQVRTPVYSDGGERMVDVGGRRFGHGTVQPTVLIGSGVQQSDGALVGPGLKSEVFLAGLTDGQTGSATNFPQNYNNPPGVIPLYGWRTSHSTLTGDVYPSLQFNADASGVSPVLRLVETGATFTPHTETLSADTISGVGIDGDDYSAQKTAGDAWDDTYVFALDMQAFATRSGFTPEGDLICNGGSITVGCYVNDGSGFELRGSVSISADCFDTATVRKNVEVGKANLGSHAGKEFATGILSENGQGGDYTGVEVTYDTATISDAPATGSGAEVFAAVHAKDDA